MFNVDSQSITFVNSTRFAPVQTMGEDRAEIHGKDWTRAAYRPHRPLSKAAMVGHAISSGGAVVPTFTYQLGAEINVRPRPRGPGGTGNGTWS